MCLLGAVHKLCHSNWGWGEVSQNRTNMRVVGVGVWEKMTDDKDSGEGSTAGNYVN